MNEGSDLKVLKCNIFSLFVSLFFPKYFAIRKNLSFLKWISQRDEEGLKLKDFDF